MGGADDAQSSVAFFTRLNFPMSYSPVISSIPDMHLSLYASVSWSLRDALTVLTMRLHCCGAGTDEQLCGEAARCDTFRAAEFTAVYTNCVKNEAGGRSGVFFCDKEEATVVR